jgi:acid stress-induced BolA-like protein IbaG/YrbA
MTPDELQRVIEEGLSSEYVAVQGDGRHFEAIVVSREFSGKNTLQQHRMVYDLLGNHFKTEAVHALSLKTYTPESWSKDTA